MLIKKKCLGVFLFFTMLHVKYVSLCSCTTNHLAFYQASSVISFIVPTYNDLPTISLTIESIYKQLPEETFEVIIIDDASTDGTFERLSVYDKMYNRENANFFLFHHNQHYGEYQTFNEAFAHTRGEYIVFIRRGVILSPRCIDIMITSLKQTKTDFVCCSEIRYFKGDCEGGKYTHPNTEKVTQVIHSNTDIIEKQSIINKTIDLTSLVCIKQSPIIYKKNAHDFFCRNLNKKKSIRQLIPLINMDSTFKISFAPTWCWYNELIVI